MSEILKANMIAVEYDGGVCFTPNWRRFYFGRPEIERQESDDERVRDRTVYRFTEIKHPRTLKKLRRLAPTGAEPELESYDSPAVPAMVVAAHVCDAPSDYEKRMSKRARERKEKYGPKCHMRRAA